ncbi:hypothetical protein DM860_009268 [Cuscuta australis]|uniref:Uncharacterized protein n=1 Tax=Cuscuta australis TaxID=267555 RepID=A0A328DEV1_9ASTE|nr:hypothetical protein DM860_009268 [Cuscuta australis]
MSDTGFLPVSGDDSGEKVRRTLTAFYVLCGLRLIFSEPLLNRLCDNLSSVRELVNRKAFHAN